MKLTIYTDGSARIVDTHAEPAYHAGWGLWGYQTDNEDKTFSAYGSTGAGNKNGRAELEAVVNGVKIAHGLKAKEVDFYIDSTYVQEGCRDHIAKWVRNGWKLSTGDPVKNMDLWKEYLIAKTSADKTGMTCTFNWVKGHSGDKGNDNADEFARMGSAASGLGETKPVINLKSFGVSKDDRDKEKEAASNGIQKKVRGVKVPEKDPLIMGARVILLTNTEPFTCTNPRDGELYNVTYSAKYVTGTKNVDRELGVESADTYQCISLSKSTDFQIEMARGIVNSLVSSDDYVIPAIIHWDKLSVGSKRKGMFTGEVELKSEEDYLYYMGEVKNKDTGLMVPTEVICGRAPMFPQKSWDVFSYFTSKAGILQHYLEGSIKDSHIVDITPILTSKVEGTKGKTKAVLNPAIKGTTFVNIDAWGKKIPLSSGKNFVPFQSLSTIIKTYQDAKYLLVRTDVNEFYFNYHVIIDSEKGIAIIDNPYSNKQYLK